MGCGQSKIGNIYPKNKKNKNNSKNGSVSIEQKSSNGNPKGIKTNNNGVEVNRNEDHTGPIDIKSQAKKKSSSPGSGPLLHQAEVSSSQVDFFKMLDEKIENGPDYDETTDAAATADRISRLLRRWELASVTWSTIDEVTGPAPPLDGHRPSFSSSRQNLTAKDREGMRNIIGGRPETAPITVRNANRVDGLQEMHSPSPIMPPRHVLESITQSPTHSQKNTPPGSSPTCIRYMDYNVVPNSSPGTFPSRIGNTDRNVQHSRNQPSYQSNDEILSQHQIYREQYLQQTGIMSVPTQCVPTSPGNNILMNNPYVQQFQIGNPEHFGSPRKRGFNAAQMT